MAHVRTTENISSEYYPLGSSDANSVDAVGSTVYFHSRFGRLLLACGICIIHDVSDGAAQTIASSAFFSSSSFFEFQMEIYPFIIHSIYHFFQNQEM